MITLDESQGNGSQTNSRSPSISSEKDNGSWRQHLAGTAIATCFKVKVLFVLPPAVSSADRPSETALSETAPSATALGEAPSQRVFRLSPLIRATLLLLYVALTLPLPFLAEVTAAPVPPAWLAIGLAIGLVALYAVLCERVVTDAEAIEVTYPAWVPRFWRKGWRLPWNEIQALKPRSTGQGGIVYYFVGRSNQAFLLPMRVAGFAELVRIVQAKTQIDTADVRPLSQPWMYLILLLFTLLLLLVDAWTIWTAATLAGGGLA